MARQYKIQPNLQSEVRSPADPTPASSAVESPVDIRPVDQDDSDEEQLRKLARRRLVSAELEDFMRYLNSPWRIVWRNIIVGLARGLGAVFGATVIFAFAIWMLKMVIDLPLIGNYADKVRQKVNEVQQETQYSDDFERLQTTMELIDQRLQTQNELLRQVLDSSSK